MSPFSLATALAVALLASPILGAQEPTAAGTEATGAKRLTWADAMAFARAQAPRSLAARSTVEEARARRVGATPWLPGNPTLSAGAGARSLSGGVAPDVDIALVQPLEIPTRRSARLEAADAGVVAAEAWAGALERTVERDAAIAFLLVLSGDERIRLAEEAARAAERTEQAAERRHAAGDVPLLDVNAARGAHARLRADRLTAMAARVRAEGALVAVLGLEVGVPVSVEGDLQSVAPLDIDPAPSVLEQRPDLRALRAQIDEAEAGLREGEAMVWPQVGLGASYALDDGDHVASALLEITLPVVDHGQGERAVSRARVEALRRQHASERQAALAGLRAALAAHRHLEAAVEELRGHALPALDENLQLARRGYQAGEVGLFDLLAIEREAAAARQHHLDLLVDAAMARVDLLAVTGARP